MLSENPMRKGFVVPERQTGNADNYLFWQKMLEIMQVYPNCLGQG